MLRTDFERDGATFKVITPAMIRMLDALFTISERTKFEIVITSVNDSTHMTTSKHYKDMAIDFRSHSFTSAQKALIQQHVRELLGPKFTLLLEDAGKPNEHFHLQVTMGMVYP